MKQEVLSWEALKEGAPLGVIKQRLESKQNRDISEAEVIEALDALVSKELLQKQGSQWKLSEPERDEYSLYPSLILRFKQQKFLSQLGVQPKSFVIEDTSRAVGVEGRYSRPDITLAAVHTWIYDPQTTLEVYSFEVKNRKGSIVPAVYEALAHARFVNHPYLVVPSSRLQTQNLNLIRRTCEREGVGLIFFDLKASTINPGFEIDNLTLEVEAERRPTNPRVVEDFLNTRFGESAKTGLQKMAQGGVHDG